MLKILGQHFKDYEINCANEDLKDNSAEILDKYAKEYPQLIKVVHKENGGVSSARIIGFVNATGKWIRFVDGVDYIAKNCVRVFAESLKDEDDFILFDLDKGDESSNLP